MRLVLFACLSIAAAGPVRTELRADGVDLALEGIWPEFSEASGNGAAYAVVRLDRAGAEPVAGRPQIPVFRELIEVPFGARIEVRAEFERVKRYELDLPLYPRQEPVPKSGPEPEFVLDPKAYAIDEFLPEFGARVTETGVMRGHRLALVEIWPVSYNPVENVMLVAERMRVSVRWTGADWGRTWTRQRRCDSPAFAGRLRGVVANPDQVSFAPGPDLPVGYLVVVPDEWEADVRPLAEWRRRKGFSVFVRTLSQVGGGSAQVVKDYIQDAYDNWPIPPSFVLLVGDVDRIGCFVGEGTGRPDTDLNFAMVEGSDYFPDIDVSRASVANAEQLDSLVEKVVAYEQNSWSSGTGWLNKAYFIASSDGGNHQVAEATHAYVMAKLRPLGVECDSLWLYYGSGTPIAEAVNSGRSWVTYSGHGGPTCWADPNPDYDIDSVHVLTNVEMVPYVQTYACDCGDFASTSAPECFSESWVRNGKRGGIAHIASSVSSFWEEDDTLERRVFDCMFDSGFHWIMGGFNRAKLIYYQQMGSGGYTRRYFEMYNMIGDGGVDVYSLEPVELTVVHPPVIPIGSFQMVVTVSDGHGPVEDALVCCAGENDTTVFASGYTDAGGQVVLSLVTSAPDTVHVTVTGYNLESYLGMALALPASGPYVLPLKYTADDSAGGNNDGIINPGETVNLMMWVKNWGSSAAQDVRTWLRTDDSNITLLDTVKQFGDIGAGDSAFTGADGFGFAVAGSCTNRYRLEFTVRSKDANDSVWESLIALMVGAAVLEYDSVQAFDPPPGGNGNGMIDPGETGELVVALRNTGQGSAAGVTAVLRSGDSRLAVLDSVGAFGDIPAESTGSNAADRFQVQADNSIPLETQIPCTLLVQTGQASFVRAFTLGIGVIRSCDPIPDGPRTPAHYYAYDVTDTLYTEAPEFAWVEIRGIGTRLTLGDDQTVEVGLPPSFGPWRYYGQEYDRISICSNGFVAPGATSYRGWNNYELPYADAPAMVALNWDDLYPPTGNGVWYFHDEPGHRFVVEFDSVHYLSPGDQWDKFQLVVFDTTVTPVSGDNVFVVQYLTGNHYVSSTIGIQDQTREIAIQCLYNSSLHRGAAGFEPGMAVRYSTVPPTVGVSEPKPDATRVRQLALEPCSPNPFGRSTRISFGVPHATWAELAVFDAAGRRVADLHQGTVQPGRYSFYWGGCDEQGRRLANGVYVLRLETDLGSVTRKAVLTH